MKNRVLTSIGIVLTLALLFVLKVLVSSYFFDAFFLVVALIAAFESAKLFTKMGKFHYSILIIAAPVVLTIFNILGVIFENEIGLSFALFIDFAIILIGFLGAFLYGLIASKKSRNEMRIRKLGKGTSLTRYTFTKALNTTVAFIYPSFLLLLMTFLNHLDEFSGTFPNIANFGGYASLTALLFMFLIPIFTDTFGYLVGGAFGGKKLAPQISPLKTWSGAVGGTAFCILLMSCVYLILNSITPISVAFEASGFAVWQVIIIAFFGSILAQLGDLFESFLKRLASVKDSGKIFPGHGGMLDRVDSYIFVAPYLLVVFAIILAII